jgi:hypothetical protein
MIASGRREIAIGVGAYAAYLAVRRLVWTSAGRERARRNALRLVSLERNLGIALEGRVQAWAVRRPRVAHALNIGYAALNVGLTLGVLVTLHRRRDPAYRTLRRGVLLAHAGALPVFLVFPVAPPRVVPGFVDTMAVVSRVDLEHPLLVRFYNPIAAFPSQHLSLAVLTGAALRKRASRRSSRAAASAYAPLVGIVVVATGNHFVLDVAAGAALGVLARTLP